MSHMSTRNEQKIRFIHIQDFSEEGILRAYQSRKNCPIYELPPMKTGEFWQALVKLDDKYYKNSVGNDYNATLISISLRQLKDNNDSAVDFSVVKYLLSFIYNIKMVDDSTKKKVLDNTRKVYVCFRQRCNKIDRDYFKLSEILRVWVAQNNMYNDVRFYDETNNPETQYPIRRLRAAYTNKDKSYTEYVSGRLFPIISVDRQTYNLLDKEYEVLNQSQKVLTANILSSLRETDEKQYATVKKEKLEKYPGAYLYAYIEKSFIEAQRNFEKYEKKLAVYYKLIGLNQNKIEKYSTSWKTLWDNFIKNYRPSVMVAILVSTIVGYIINDKFNDLKQKIKDIKNEIKDKNSANLHTVINILTDDNWVTLIERCYSYAQGILQLIDNANTHVVEKKDKNGQSIGNGAFFGFRVRDKNNVLNENADKDLKQCNYFLEMFIVDCDFSDQVGIVRNYNNTLLKMNDYDKQGVLSIDNLKEVFNYPQIESQALKEYYSHTKNIAFHYGLQIFSGVVSSGNGFLSVVSGREGCGTECLSGITYSNDDINYNKKDLCGYYVGSVRMPSPSMDTFNSDNCDDNIVNFSGTSYMILLPVVMPNLKNNGYNYFLGNINIGGENIKNLNVCTITPVVNSDLTDIVLSEYNGEQIMCINLAHINERKQIEYICKSMLVKFVEKVEIKALCFTGFKNEYALLDAVRVISLFYNKLGEFEQIKNKGIFLYCRYKPVNEDKDKEYELYFNGVNLYSIFDNIRRQQLVRYIPELFIHELEAFLCRERLRKSSVVSLFKDEKYELDNRPLSAAIIKYNLKVYDNNETIVQKQIKDVLNSDIHLSPLGCKIENTHVRIGRVHLDTFYEAQFLFGNAYFTDIFAVYVADRVNKQKEKLKLEWGKEYDRIVLYGYESYSTLTLNKALHFLDNKNDKVKMLVYETVNERVRYISKDLFIGKTLIVYVMGISSTLSTFKQMNDAFTKECDKLGIQQDNLDKLCLSIIQIDGEGSENFITKIEEHDVVAYTTVNDLDYIKFALNNMAYCFVSAQSKWYAAEEGFCIHCLPEHNKEKKNSTILDELPLIEVDDTSVVPTQMIFLKDGCDSRDSDYDCGRKNAEKFLSINDNFKYLRYGHIERYDNHFQYFFRIAALYRDKQDLNENAGEIGIEQWLNSVRDRHSDAFDFSEKTVNILIAPQHFSNTGYVNSVSQCVFGDTAHIIELDIRKEYRSNFRTKYSNYRELANFVKKNRDENGDNYKLNFYYVNDQIVTGRTFKRAESLINTLLGKDAKGKGGKTFSGVFTLVDRNSYETRKSYVTPVISGDEEYLPFFSYLRFDIPSIRNHDNSCPLCAQNEAAEKIVDSSAFTSTAHYWQEKIVYHKQRTSEDMRKIDSQMNSSNKELYFNTKMRNFRRLQCENDLWKELNHCKDRYSAYKSLVYTILSRCPQTENCPQDENSLFDFIKKLEQEDSELYFAIFKLTIARLCAIGSCVLLNRYRLMNCLKIGNYLDKVTKANNVIKNVYSGEYIISFIKVMSRPLLYYREPIKWAVMQLLIRILNIYLNNTQIIKKFDDVVHEGKQETVYYDQGFDGFLLNSLKRLLSYDKGVSKCNYCDKLVFENGDVFNGQFAEFFKRLYIENNRSAYETCKSNLKLDDERNKSKLNVRIKENGEKLEPDESQSQKIEELKKNKLECKEESKEQLFNQVKIDKFERIIDKYDYIVSRLKQICFNEDCTGDIAFFIVNQNDSTSYIKKNGYTWIGGDKNISIIEDININDFYYNECESIYYVNIGNNYSRFNTSASNAVYHYCEELGLAQDACVIMGVRTDNVDTLRNILAFRKEILREAEKDFNNGIVNELSMSKRVAKDLTSSEATSHSSSSHMPYGRLFRRLGYDLEAQCDILSAYMSLIISEYYRDLVKRSLDQDGVESPQKNIKDADDTRISINVKDIMPTVNFAGTVGAEAASYIAFAVKMINYKIHGSSTAENKYVSKISVMFNDKDLLNQDEKNIKKLFEGFYLYDQFRSSPDDVVTVFMIVDTLIRNAESHCNASKRSDLQVDVIFDIKDDKSIDLVVKNTYNKSDDPRTGKGITLYALANLFGTNIHQNSRRAFLWHSRLNLDDENLFTGKVFEVRISNYLFKI